MEPKPELQVGNLLVVRDRPGRFAIQDVRDPDLRQIVLTDEHVPKLISFLYRSSESSQKHLRVDNVATAHGPHLTNKPPPSSELASQAETSQPPAPT
jgi:hypothetical protein